MSSTASCLQAATSVVEQRVGRSTKDLTMPLTGLSFSPSEETQKLPNGLNKIQQGDDNTLLKAYRDTVSGTESTRDREEQQQAAIERDRKYQREMERIARGTER